MSEAIAAQHDQAPGFRQASGFRDCHAVFLASACGGDHVELRHRRRRLDADPLPGLDTDADGIADASDTCIESHNPDQRDSDGDGIGNICDADLDNDCIVNFSDLGVMKALFFGFDPDADLDGDGVVNFSDLGIMKQRIFGLPGPSCTPNICDQ